MGNNIRLKKAASLIRDEVSRLIIQGKVKDPRVSTLISVTEVVVSKDLAYAKIYVSSLIPGESLNTSIKALNGAAGFIQKEISPRIKFRNTPKLTFIADTSIKEGFEINKKIDGLSE